MVGSEKGTAAPARKPLPIELGQLEGFDFCAHYYADRVGGDFYDAVRVGSRVAFLVSDIAGKRPQTDVISAAMQDAFRAKAPELFGAPAANLMEGTEMLVQAVNHALIQAAKDGIRFAPTLVACYDAPLGVLAYINAGGQTVVIQDSEGVRDLPNASVPLGLTTHFTYEASVQVLEPGAKLLVATKGVTQSRHGKTPFGAQRVREAMEGARNEPAGKVCEAVLAAAHDFQKGRWEWLGIGHQSADDDMTALVLARHSCNSATSQ